jgi:hypothetical protein
MTKNIYATLSTLAQEVCNANGYDTNDKILEAVRELKITCRQDWDIPREVYSRWPLSKFFEEMVRQHKLDPIVLNDAD